MKLYRLKPSAFGYSHYQKGKPYKTTQRPPDGATDLLILVREYPEDWEEVGRFKYGKEK